MRHPQNEAAGMQVRDVELKLIDDNPYQTRKGYPKGDLKLLAVNISKRGLLHPISVVKVRDRFVIVAGHRRARAYRLLKRKTIPAIIRKKSAQEDLALDMAIENCLRKDFLPVEKADAIFQALRTIPNIKTVEHAFSVIGMIKNRKRRGDTSEPYKGAAKDLTFEDSCKAEKILKMIDVSENSATQYLRLTTLPVHIKEKVIVSNENGMTAEKHLAQGYISVSYGYELSRVKDDKLKVRLYDKIIKDKMNMLTLRSVVDEILEENPEQKTNKLGGAGSYRANDYGMLAITKQSNALAARIWNFRRFIRIIPFNLDKVLYRAGMKRLRYSCLELIGVINEVLDDLKDGDLIKLGTADQPDLLLSYSEEKHNMRFTFPQKTIQLLRLRDGDKVRFKITSIQRARVRK